MYMSKITRKKNTGEPGNPGEFGHRVNNAPDTGLGGVQEDLGGTEDDNWDGLSTAKEAEEAEEADVRARQSKREKDSERASREGAESLRTDVGPRRRNPRLRADSGPGVVLMPPGIRASMEADRALRSMSWETPQYVKDALERKKKSRLDNQNSESESE